MGDFHSILLFSMPIVFLGLQSLTVRHCGSHFASSNDRFFEPSLLVSIVFCAFWFLGCFTTESLIGFLAILLELVGDSESLSAPPLVRHLAGSIFVRS